VRRLRAILLAGALLAVSGGLLAAQTRFDLAEVRWTVAPAPGGDEVHLEMQLAPLHDRDRVVLRMPLWRPGSYNYANFQKRVSDLTARDGEGRERQVRKLDPRTWEIESTGAAALTVTYELDVDNEAGPDAPPAVHLNGPMTFLYLEDALKLPHSLLFELPEGWQVASGHRPVPGHPGLFRSPDYDVFVDCPIALGALERYGFESHGTPFEVVFFGRPPAEEDLPRKAWVEKVQAIVGAAHDIVGTFPFEKYVFLFLFNNTPGGYGLEHLNSTSIGWNYLGIRKGRTRGLESVTAHEFFHLWNVKRIRPRQLGPFDYSTDVRTRDLWWLEGVTSYYGDVIQVRAGLRKEPNWFWDAQARVFAQVSRSPGWGVVSPERASWTVWKPDPAHRISYYDQGQVLGFLLDLKIRAATHNRRSLDDVVRFLFRWVDYPDPGYRPGDLERAIRAVTGWDDRAFFERYVRGVLPFPLEEVLPEAGLRVRSSRPSLGIRLDAKLAVTLEKDSPAAKGGLQNGDLLKRIGDTRVRDRDGVRRLVDSLAPGSTVALQVERAGKRLKIELPVKERKLVPQEIRPDPDAASWRKGIPEGILKGIPEPI